MADSLTPIPPFTTAVHDDPAKPYKAYMSTALTVVVAFVLYWISDEDPFTKKEIAEGAVAALVGGGLVGGGTYFTKNPKRFLTR